MSDNFLGEIRMFGGNYAPQNWAFCNGQLLPIMQNQALFSILGTNFGGNGTTTFALPDLRSRVGVDQGNGAGLTPRTLAEVGGVETVTLSLTQIPQHLHPLTASTANATLAVPGSTAYLGSPTVAAAHFYTKADGTTPPPVAEALVGPSVGQAGSNQSHTNLMPTLCVSYIIALSGVFPSRN